MTPAVVLLLDAPVPEWLPAGLVRDVGGDFASRIAQLIAELQMSRIPPDWPVVVAVAPVEEAAAVADWKSAKGRQVIAQPVGDPGARIAALAAAAASARPGPLVIVRCDCPYLDERALAAAAEALSRTDCVIGPTSDGDFYLLGFQDVPSGIFDGIEWGTNQVFFSIERQARAGGLHPVLLDTLERVTDGRSWSRAVERIVPPGMRGE